MVDAYKNLMRKLQQTISSTELALLKEEKILRVTNAFMLQERSQELNPRLYIPIYEIQAKLQVLGMVKTTSFSPKACERIFKYHDVAIIEYYKKKALGFLEYYSPAINFHVLKKIVDYHMRWSLIHTLAGKHLKKVWEIIKLYGKTPTISIEMKNSGGLALFKILTSFLTSNNIKHRKRKFTNQMT